MANLVPGTRGGTLANLSFNFSQARQTSTAPHSESLITYDGAPAVRTRSNGTSLGAADVDSTQEMQILTANYSPEYGRSPWPDSHHLQDWYAGFPWRAYEYFAKPSSMQSLAAQCEPATTGITAPIHYNQFGYNVGGPFYIPGHFNTTRPRSLVLGRNGCVTSLPIRTLSPFHPTDAHRRFQRTPRSRISTMACRAARGPKTACHPGNISSARTATTGSTATANGSCLNAYPAPNLTTAWP